MATKFITVSIEIMHDSNLSPNQKFIYAEIEQLSSLDKGCIASNKHFAELIGITKQGVSKAIKGLQDMGYIKIDNTTTRRNVGRRIYLATAKKSDNNDKEGKVSSYDQAVNEGGNSGLHPINSGLHPINSGLHPINSGLQSKENRTVNRTINRTVSQSDDAKNKKFKLSPSWKPDEKKLDAYLAFSMIKIDQIKPEWISEFYSYWALGDGAKVSRTDDGWLKTYVNTMIKWVKSPGLFEKLNGYVIDAVGRPSSTGGNVKPVPRTRDDARLKRYCAEYGFTYPCPQNISSYDLYWDLLDRERTKLIDKNERVAKNDGVLSSSEQGVVYGS